MKRIIFSLIFVALLLTACQSAPNVKDTIPPYIDTGIDSDAWATIPAGKFLEGQENVITLLDYDYDIMVTDVTVEQYANFLNEAIANGDAKIGKFEVVVANGERTWKEEGVAGYYSGDPFDGHKHEEEITSGDKLYVSFVDGLRLTRDGDTFSAIPEFANHPMTMVSWYGANAYCKYYGYHLPLNEEWEKAARGTAFEGKDAYPFPWGYEIAPNNANYYASDDLFEELFGKLGSTNPVGFYNGKTYKVNGITYETMDGSSPYGLYDMAGNVWQWTGDDYPNQHYRIMRGGSFYTYEVDLRVWKENDAGPQHYAPEVGFRCAK